MSTFERHMFDPFREDDFLPELDLNDPEDARWIRTRSTANCLGINALISLLLRKGLVSEAEIIEAIKSTAQYEQRHRLFEVNEAVLRSDYFMHAGGAEAVTILGRASRLVPSDTVLEVGVGHGGEARQISEEFRCRVVGLDRNITRICESILRTRAMGMDRRIDFKLGNASDMPFDDSSFEVVWFQGFPFGDDNPPDEIVEEAVRVLKPHGRLAMVAEPDVTELAVKRGLSVIHHDASLPTNWHARRWGPEDKTALVMMVAQKAI